MGMLNEIFKKISIKTQAFEISILYICLAISLITLVIYLLDMNLSDKALFFLLIVLKYSSTILCICSLYRLLVNIYHIIRRPSVLRAMKNLLYLVFIIYGTIAVLLETFVSVIAGGNG
jgi:hypothetical protein